VERDRGDPQGAKARTSLLRLNGTSGTPCPSQNQVFPQLLMAKDLRDTSCPFVVQAPSASVVKLTHYPKASFLAFLLALL
jgi:hypothetical protein